MSNRILIPLFVATIMLAWSRGDQGTSQATGFAWSNAHAATASTPPSRPENQDAAPRIALVAPMPHELDPIVRAMHVSERLRIRGRRVLVGTIAGVPVVAMETGVGMTNAASGITLLLERFSVRSIVMTGVAGGINRDRGAGDVVIIEKSATLHQGAIMENDVFEAYGARDPFDLRRLPVMLASDAGLVAALAKAAQTSVAHKSTGLALEPSGTVVRGIGISGDCFIACEQYATRLWNQFGAECIDMEASVLAQLCTLEGVPFAIVRCISDRGTTGSNNDYARNMHAAAEIAGGVVVDWVRQQEQAAPPAGPTAGQGGAPE